MNKHLVDFIDDELKTNGYYENIRKFAEDKDWNRDILSPAANEYEDQIDHLGPYRFLDAIEDFLMRMEEEHDPILKSATDLDEIIHLMWQNDFFEQY